MFVASHAFRRHMLSRSSGMAYAFLDPLMSKYQNWHGAKPKNNLTIVRCRGTLLDYEINPLTETPERLV